MGTIHHHAVIVTGWKQEDVEAAHAEALSLYGKVDPVDGDAASLVGPIMAGLTNGYFSFTIHPDGSKEWWPTSDACDAARGSFIQWLGASGRYLDWVEVGFGELGTHVRATGEGDT